MRSNNEYPSLIKIDKELSLRPIDSKNSFFSFLFSIIAISDSILAEIFKFFVFFQRNYLLSSTVCFQYKQIVHQHYLHK